MQTLYTHTRLNTQAHTHGSPDICVYVIFMRINAHLLYAHVSDVYVCVLVKFYMVCMRFRPWRRHVRATGYIEWYSWRRISSVGRHIIQHGTTPPDDHGRPSVVPAAAHGRARPRVGPALTFTLIDGARQVRAHLNRPVPRAGGDHCGINRLALFGKASQ